MTRALVLAGVTVDIAERALLVVGVPTGAGAMVEGTAATALAAADVVEIDAERSPRGPAAEPGAVAVRVEDLRREVGLPVVVRTGRAEVVRAAVAAGVAGIDVRERWADPGLMVEAAAAGLVVTAGSIPAGAAPEEPGPDPIVRAATAAGLPRGQLVVETDLDGGADRGPASGGTGPVRAWTAGPGDDPDPRALAGVALAITTGHRWIRVGTAEGFGPVRDTLAAVEGARTGRSDVGG